MTNADKVRVLPNSTIAYILSNACQGTIVCHFCPLEDFCGGTAMNVIDWFDWLESEAEE